MKHATVATLVSVATFFLGMQMRMIRTHFCNLTYAPSFQQSAFGVDVSAATTDQTRPFANVLPDASNTLTNNVDGRPPSLRRGHIVLVQGEASAFSTWYHRIKEVAETYNNDSGGGVTLIFASYDVPLSPLHEPLCRGGIVSVDSSRFSCQTMFIPQTTWTQGRNLLARAALCAEERIGHQFLYWTFSDDDAEMVCHVQQPGVPMEQSPRGVACWQRWFRLIQDQLYGADVPVVAAVVSELQDPTYYPAFVPSSYTVTDYYGKELNSFHRNYVEHLMPYCLLAKESSEWNSQAAHGFLMEACFHHMGILPQQFRVTNEVHRDYARHLNFTQMRRDALHNYQSFVPHLSPREKIRDILHYNRKTVLSTWDDVLAHVAKMKESRKPVAEQCHALTRRFQEWLSTQAACPL